MRLGNHGVLRNASEYCDNEGVYGHLWTPRETCEAGVLHNSKCWHDCSVKMRTILFGSLSCDREKILYRHASTCLMHKMRVFRSCCTYTSTVLLPRSPAPIFGTLVRFVLREPGMARCGGSTLNLEHGAP